MKFKTKGMHCSSCEMLVIDSIEDLDGVKSVEASCSTGIIDVDFDSSKTSADKIAKIIKKEGFEVIRGEE
jgi:copper chaperone CopZ